MANLASVPDTRPLSRKGMAQPMQVEDDERRATVGGAIAWHPSAPQRTHVSEPRGATGHASALAHSVARMRPQRVRISTRLDPDLHHRLKSHAAAVRRTQQSVVVQALEDYLADEGEIPHRFGDRRAPAPR